MSQTPKHDKVSAIYELREAAEEKARAEAALEQAPSPEARDALLDAHLYLEEKTQEALEACHECGHVHADGESHGIVTGTDDNVVHVDFRPAADAGGA